MIKPKIKNRDLIISTLVKGVVYNKALFMFLAGGEVDTVFNVNDIFYIKADHLSATSDDTAKNVLELLDDGNFTMYKKVEYISVKIGNGYNVGDTSGPFWDTKVWASYQMFDSSGIACHSQQALVETKDLIDKKVFI